MTKCALSGAFPCCSICLRQAQGVHLIVAMLYSMTQKSLQHAKQIATRVSAYRRRDIFQKHASGLRVTNTKIQLLHCRLHSELSGLGYPVSPMCQLDKSLFATHDTTINPEPAALSEGFSDPSERPSSPEGTSSTQGRAEQAGKEEEGWQEEEEEDSPGSKSIPEWQTVFESWMTAHSFGLDHTTFVVKPATASHRHEAWLVNSLEMLLQRAQQVFEQVRLLLQHILYLQI